MENKRRGLSGIFIFDQFPGEERREPTCVEDCQKETRKNKTCHQSAKHEQNP